MICDFTTLSHRGIQVLSPYVPGKSIECNADGSAY